MSVPLPVSYARLVGAVAFTAAIGHIPGLGSQISEKPEADPRPSSEALPLGGGVMLRVQQGSVSLRLANFGA